MSDGGSSPPGSGGTSDEAEGVDGRDLGDHDVVERRLGGDDDEEDLDSVRRKRKTRPEESPRGDSGDEVEFVRTVRHRPTPSGRPPEARDAAGADDDDALASLKARVRALEEDVRARDVRIAALEEGRPGASMREEEAQELDPSQLKRVADRALASIEKRRTSSVDLDFNSPISVTSAGRCQQQGIEDVRTWVSKDDGRDGEARDDIDVALSRLKRSPSATQLWAESRARDRTVATSEKVYRLWADPAESPRGSAARGGDGLSRLWADPASSAADY